MIKDYTGVQSINDVFHIVVKVENVFVYTHIFDLNDNVECVVYALCSSIWVSLDSFWAFDLCCNYVKFPYLANFICILKFGPHPTPDKVLYRKQWTVKCTTFISLHHYSWFFPTVTQNGWSFNDFYQKMWEIRRSGITDHQGFPLTTKLVHPTNSNQYPTEY